MAQAKEHPRHGSRVFMGEMPPLTVPPMATLLAELNASLFEAVATAQKEWADFVHRRVKEDIAVSRRLLRCHSLADMHHVYAQYLQTAFDQYQEKSEKAVQRGESAAQDLAQSAESGAKEAARARH
jgi:vacuolar-type H+-ATPase subunit H